MNIITADGVGKSVGTITDQGRQGRRHHRAEAEGAAARRARLPRPREAELRPGRQGRQEDRRRRRAGAHFDPDGTKAHKGPGGGGHKGDLPKLVVSDKGEAKDKMEVKGVTLADFQGHALMIHAGGDNYSDTPKPLGGGGERIACGVAK